MSVDLEQVDWAANVGDRFQDALETLEDAIAYAREETDWPEESIRLELLMAGVPAFIADSVLNRPEIVVLIASTRQQADMACQQLGLPRPGLRGGRVAVYAVCNRAGLSGLAGLCPARVIEAMPVLGNDHFRYEAWQALSPHFQGSLEEVYT